ncbi:hypothetical protein RHMOL_Rhmol03G0084400 [Rhododendron molle]|uniref:Uncharacterized protein n=1 Tax=Rhododendron molle TaxID=49168 RepID=A0ACC0PEG0_RHOML|nr:hypothetical protein RHMOL_Rhmol03G0084400 [Rhododendron molle]
MDGVTHGNHDVESILSYPEAFKAYNARWSGSTSNLYYSFDVVGTHIFLLGSCTDFNPESDQYEWLFADLAKVDRTVTTWLIALLHTPWYNTNKSHEGSSDSMRKVKEEMLYKARVDVVYASHVHAYERFTRVYDKKEDPCGPVYVTIGDGGNREGLAMSYEKPSPSISLYREPSFGHGRLRIVNNTHAYRSWHRNNEPDSNVGDEVWLESLSSSSACMQVLNGQESPSKFVTDEL